MGSQGHWETRTLDRKVKRGFKWFQGVSKDFKGLQGVSRGYKWFQGVLTGWKGLEGLDGLEGG